VEQSPARRADADDTADDDVGRIDDFDAMALQECVLRGIFRCGYERPSDIQARGIPAILSGRDCVSD
jgi:superfamily II DNA/RNA helicase